MSTKIQFYEGKRLDPKFNPDIPKSIDPYLPDDNLVKAVKLAQILGRPLLLKGEPGCGKSRLAEAVAFELFEDHVSEKTNTRDRYYFEWYVKSDSKAKDGLYMINYLERLRNANLHKEGVSLDITLNEGASKGTYIELGPLGKAFSLTNKMDANLPPPVLLIDEIDKADIDFPNDLLLELDKMEFEISEITGNDGNPRKIRANKEKKPLIIITSNDEKPLPAAFLRRCLFHFINYPGAERLQEIVEAKFPQLKENDIALKASLKFESLRGEIEKAGIATKNISTSELLDWVRIMDYNLKQHNEQPEFTEIQNMQALAKDVETMQIFMKYNEEMVKNKKPEQLETAVV